MTPGVEQDFQRFDRCYWRRVAFLIFIAFCLALLLLPLLASAEPRLRAEQGGVVITLYDEPCELKDQIANLPYKATWEEKGKVYRGCFVPHQQFECAIAYFDDKTVALIPFAALTRIVGT